MALHLVRVTVSRVTVCGFGFRVSTITVEIVTVKVNTVISGAFFTT